MIALRDCPLLNLDGLHAPYFLRIIFKMEFGWDYQGIAEIPGDARIKALLEDPRTIKILKGRQLTLEDLATVCAEVRYTFRELLNEARGDKTHDTRVLVHALAAIETAWLDALAQRHRMSLADLLASKSGSRARPGATVNGYVFLVADTVGSGLDYETLDIPGWKGIRTQPALDEVSFVRLVKAAYEEYGFKYWKLKGGVLDGMVEAKLVEAAYRAVGGEWTLDPNGAWKIPQALQIIRYLADRGIIKYIEDPVRGLLAMKALFKLTKIPQASNMVGTDWKSLFEAVGQGAVQRPLADPHFWCGPMSGLEVIRALINAGCMPGVHSNNHGLTSLAAVIHMLAAIPEHLAHMLLAADTHFIHTREDDPVVSEMRIRDGAVMIPRDCQGLGVTLHEAKLWRAERKAEELGTGKRDDAIQMRMLPQFRQSGWERDPQMPAMVRPAA